MNRRESIALPLIGLFPDQVPVGAGIEPDVAVVPSVADIAAGRDAEMAAMLALIESTRG